jgi:hypothetical protein
MHRSNARLYADIGRRIFLAVPAHVRPGWAATLLELLAGVQDQVPTEVQDLLRLIEDADLWPAAHEQFTRIRQYALLHALDDDFLRLAEMVAKVTYNASNRPAPFDADSGWYIAGLAARVANRAADEALRREVYRLLALHLPANEHNQVDFLLADGAAS